MISAASDLVMINYSVHDTIGFAPASHFETKIIRIALVWSVFSFQEHDCNMIVDILFVETGDHLFADTTII